MRLRLSLRTEAGCQPALERRSFGESKPLRLPRHLDQCFAFQYQRVSHLAAAGEFYAAAFFSQFDDFDGSFDEIAALVPITAEIRLAV